MNTETHTSAEEAVFEHIRLYDAIDLSEGFTEYDLYPQEEALAHLVKSVFTEVMDACMDTALETELQSLFWGITNAFHAQTNRLERKFDDYRYKMEQLTRAHDGSEVSSYEIEQAQEQAHSTCQKRDAFETMTNLAAEHYMTLTNSTWTPYNGSRTDHRSITASVLDSKQFLKAQADAKRNRHLPQGTIIAITGGMDFTDIDAVHSILDKVHHKYPDMVLIHGGAHKGIDVIASAWASKCNVHQVAFKPNWTRDGKKRAGFIRNDAIIAQQPQGLIAFKGTGVNDNLVDKAIKNGIKVLDYRS